MLRALSSELPSLIFDSLPITNATSAFCFWYAGIEDKLHIFADFLFNRWTESEMKASLTADAPDCVVVLPQPPAHAVQGFSIVP
jgi:hypothetical protein